MIDTTFGNNSTVDAITPIAKYGMRVASEQMRVMLLLSYKVTRGDTKVRNSHKACTYQTAVYELNQVEAWSLIVTKKSDE